MQDFRIDSHKLIFHVERVNSWLKGRTVCPIYLEIAPSAGCNHRCIFCAVDYLKYKPIFLDTVVLLRAIVQAGNLGVKSIMFAGEGEPLLHKDIEKIIDKTKKSKIDVSITTNGVFLKKDLSAKLLKDLSWIRISFNAGTSDTYSDIHGAPRSDFEKVLTNLSDAVEIKKRQKLSVTIGVQMLLIPQNINEVVSFARLLKKIGVGYLSIKPYSQHPLSASRIAKNFNYKNYFELDKQLAGIGTDNFLINFRSSTMKRLSEKKDYQRCLGLPFWAYIDASGDVYACSAFLGKKEFVYGNIYKQSMSAITKGARRKKIIKMVSNNLYVDTCRLACRLDKINSYLWELKHPGPHVNFI